MIRDLGCGTGSMGALARTAAARPADLGPARPRRRRCWPARRPACRATAADGTPVTARAEQGDLTDLDAAQLAGTSLVTASALLDLLTADEVDALADACTAAGCPALLTLSVTGSVAVLPAEPLDAVFAAAFDAHQRRTVGRRGPAPARARRRRDRRAYFVWSANAWDCRAMNSF